MRFEYPDFAKGYAITTIVLFHALQRVALPGFFAQAIVFGGTGVHLFFFLSGFGLAISGKALAVSAFYRRRLFKIWLPYVLALSLSLGLALVWHIFPDGWAAWLAGVALYQMFFEPWIESFGGHFWFISTILQFYLAYPLLDAWQRRSRSPWTFWLPCLLISVVWWLLVWALDKGQLRTWNSCFLQFLWEFALGMALARAIRQHELPVWCLAWWQAEAWWRWVLAGSFFSGLMLLIILKLGAVGRIFNDIPAFLGYTSLSIALYWLSSYAKRFFLWVGGFSFSLYLVHILVLELLIALLYAVGRIFSPIWLLLFFACALVAGLLFERLSNRVQAWLNN